MKGMVSKERYDELQLRLAIAEARNSELEAQLEKAEKEKAEAIRRRKPSACTMRQ